METAWEKQLACASLCHHCQTHLGPRDARFLSVFDHQPICRACKQSEELRPDYADRSKQMIAECITATGRPYGEPAGYCFHHFCPFTCKQPG
jgi:hypothetical protein